MRLSVFRDTLRTDFDPRTERGRMVRSAGATAALKVGATLLAFGASLIYARALGPHDYGLYAYVIAWAMLVTIPVTMGLPGLLVREGAKAPASVRWLRRWADHRVIPAGLAAAILMCGAFFLPQAAGARWLFVVAALLPLCNALQRVRAGLLRARGWVARSQWPSQIAAPALMLAALALLWSIRGNLRPVDVVAAMLGAALLQALVNGLQLRYAAATPRVRPDTPLGVRAALPFMWLGGMYLLNSRVDLIMLGSLKGAHDAGIYAIATRAAGLVPFIAGAASKVLASRIARLHHADDRKTLQRMITAAARRVLVASLPLALLLMIAAWWLLRYLYGPEFTPAARPLQILAGCQLLSLAMGSTGIILNMAGHERVSMRIVGTALGLNIVLNAILIPPFGVEGAAVATGVSVVVRKMLMWYWLRRRLQLRPTAFGL